MSFLVNPMHLSFKPVLLCKPSLSQPAAGFIYQYSAAGP